MQANNEGRLKIIFSILTICYKFFARLLINMMKRESRRRHGTGNRQDGIEMTSRINTDGCEEIGIVPSVSPKIRVASPHPHRNQQGDRAQSAGIEGKGQ